MSRGKKFYALTHTTCIAVIDNKTGQPTGLYRCATEEEAHIILDIVEESK